MTLQFDNSYARALPEGVLRLDPDVAPAPRLLQLNVGLLAELGVQVSAAEAALWFSGAGVPPGAEPVAQAYAGHQFGGFSPKLGDGRAHLLGEVRGLDGRRWDVALKGSGRTPFSRGGDGKAAVGPMLREYVISEAMQALGIPTTRALAVVGTGERVWRETGGLPGAVLARVAASHIRVGTFQYFYARGDGDNLRKLLDYTISRHYPEAALAQAPALAMFDAVVARQARLIALWMGGGFIHGVMNTDNMALSGETIDYGPCGFMEGYAPGTVFSSIDSQGRYAYANQPLILGWNLARLAETLLGFFAVDPDQAVEIANGRLVGIAGIFHAEWLAVMRGKLGIAGEDAGDGALVEDFLALIEGVDWTLAFHRLGVEDTGLIKDQNGLQVWLARWTARRGAGWQAMMAAANPSVIPRNHLVEEALTAATAGDMAPFEALLAAVRLPYGPMAGRERFGLPAPGGFGAYVTYCGT